MKTSSFIPLSSCGITYGIVLGSLLAIFARAQAAAQERTGEMIYRQQCALCHGVRGEGDKEKYPRPLAGDRSVDQLIRFISKRMPKDDPGKCVGEDARKVASYIYEAFYSASAQARNKSPRIELSRLTVRQYRYAVADLIASFRTSKRNTVDNRKSQNSSKPGLRGEYYKLKFDDSDRIFKQIDPEIRFDFEQSSPDPNNDSFKNNQFSIRWRGAVLAPETGEYEFMIRTEHEHGVRLWVNDLKHVLIDAWARSGKKTESGEKSEYRGSVFLLGGRYYPLQLEFSKLLTLGLDNSIQPNNGESVQASIDLRWKPPQRAVEVIPPRNLIPYRHPETFVVATPFPPDDRNTGYERGVSISKAWDEAVTAAATEGMTYVASHLGELAGVASDAADARTRLRDFCLRFTERAFRHPLTAEQRQLYVERQFEVARDLDTAVKRVVLLVLMSPPFLYREISSQEAYDTASRLSFGLWDSLPDADLLQAAAAGRLSTREQVAQQVERLLTHSLTRAKLREFFLHWLKLDQVGDLAKDAKMFPGFNPEIVSDLRTSLDLFLDEVVWSTASDFRQLWHTDTLYLNGRLARFYGVKLPADAPFQKVAWQSGASAGVLSHPYLMARFAHATSSSPILRGVFLTRYILGRSLPPPPVAFDLEPADRHPQLTTRERVVLQTRPQACMACHGIINSLGFTLENFDAAGRFRNQENGKPIDATGFYQTRTGEEMKFGGPRDLAQFVAQSEEVQEAFVKQLFQYLIKQPIGAFGSGKLAELRQSFADNQFSIRKLLIAIMADSTLIARKSPEPKDENHSIPKKTDRYEDKRKSKEAIPQEKDRKKD